MIIIADSGSTKTDWVAVQGKSIINTWTTVGLNPYYLNSESIAKVTVDTFEDEIKDKISEIHFYGTGITDIEKSEIIKKGLFSFFDKNTTINTFSDVVASARALFGNTQGIACILGTGSNSCLWNGEKISFQVPPLGFWLGDEGSGAHMGKMLILSYLHNELPAAIKKLFIEKYGNIDRLDVLNNMNNDGTPNKYFGKYSEFIFHHKSNPKINSIICESIEEFFEKYLLKYPTIENENIGFIGSIAKIYEEQINEISKQHSLKSPIIIQKPIERLIEYHSM